MDEYVGIPSISALAKANLLKFLGKGKGLVTVQCCSSSARSFKRALPNRDITVPVGQFRTLAISLYDSSSYSRSKMISRNFMGNL